MNNSDLEKKYEEALQLQKSGDLAGLTSLIKSLYKQGVPGDDLSVFGALVESTFNNIKRKEPTKD